MQMLTWTELGLFMEEKRCLTCDYTSPEQEKEEKDGRTFHGNGPQARKSPAGDERNGRIAKEKQHQNSHPNRAQGRIIGEQGDRSKVEDAENDEGEGWMTYRGRDKGRSRNSRDRGTYRDCRGRR
ncbi:unnamed protein product [Rhizophagus irregularis]|nr:unnamed protein product [Rhizophagus irregularis]